MAMRNIYHTIDRVGLVTTGNTLVSYGNPLKLTTIDNKRTTNYKENGASAYLNIKDDALIVDAYLVTNTIFKDENVNLENQLEEEITFITPKGEYSISSPSHFILKNVNKAVVYYNVKDYIVNSKSGYYGVKGVPVVYDESSMTCGFTLFVIYKMQLLPINYVFIRVGPSPVDSVTDYMVQFTGFDVSDSKGYLTAIGNAESYDGMNHLEIGPTRTVYEQMGSSKEGVSPNNNINNFFASQVNIADQEDPFYGLINTLGTNGLNNSDSYLKKYKENDRFGYDLAYVNLEKFLNVGQKEYFIRLSATENTSKIATMGLAMSLNSNGGSLWIENTTKNIPLKINEEKTITYKITNDSDKDINDLTYYMNLNEAFTFVKDSMILDGSTITGDLINGFNLGNIKSNEEKNITFKIIPTVNGTDLVSAVKMEYNFLLYEGKTIYVETVGDNLILNVMDDSTAFIEFEYAVDNKNIALDSTFTSNIVVTNNGTAKASNILIKDIMSDSLEFVKNSVTYNGNITDYNIVDGFTIESLAAGESAKITFDTKAVALNENVQNKVTSSYQYVDINGATQTVNVESNSLVLSIKENKEPDVVVDVSFEPKIVKTDDKISYNIKINNNSDMTLYNVNIVDILPKELEFVENSIKINDKLITSNLNEGIIINKIDNGEIVNISFDVLAVLKESNIKNSVEVSYMYENELGNHKGISHSNVLIFDIDSKDIVDFNIIQTTAKEIVALGNSNSFNVIVQNLGNVTAEKVILTNLLPANYEYIENTLMIDGVKSNQNINEKIVLENLSKDDVVNITYDARAITLGDNVRNSINGKFEYNDEVVVVESNNKNTHILEPKEAVISVESKNNKGTQELDKNIIYEIDLENLGDTLATDIIIKDKLNNGLEFVANSITIDGIVQENKNIIDGITINELNPGQKMVVKYSVKSVSVGENISNEISVDYKYEDAEQEIINVTTKDHSLVDIVKKFDPNINLHFTVDNINNALNDDVINQIVIKNNGNTPAFNLKITANYSEDYEYVNDSLRVDGNNVTGNLKDGINLEDLRIDDETVITYSLKGIKTSASNINNVELTYTYFDGDGKEVIKSITSQNVLTNITELSYADLEIVKLSCYKILPVNEINTYSISIKNIGNTLATNILIKDVLDDSFDEVNGTIKVNGKQVDGTISNLLIDSLEPNEVTIIEFQALAKAVKNNVSNIVHVDYSYEDKKNIIYNVKEESNMVNNTIIKDVPEEVIELLNNIAKKESGISDLLDKEAKKIEKTLNITDDKNKILNVNESVKEMIASLKNTETTTKENLENILKMLTA